MDTVRPPKVSVNDTGAKIDDSPTPQPAQIRASSELTLRSPLAATNTGVSTGNRLSGEGSEMNEICSVPLPSTIRAKKNDSLPLANVPTEVPSSTRNPGRPSTVVRVIAAPSITRPGCVGSWANNTGT